LGELAERYKASSAQKEETKGSSEPKETFVVDQEFAQVTINERLNTYLDHEIEDKILEYSLYEE
jgi:hypothetical protein